MTSGAVRHSPCIRRGDARYPALLGEIDHPPEVLYWEGDPGVLSRPAVAIVGSRRATDLGVRMAERLGAGLARRGIVVVSGLAYGIDAAAHRGALQMGTTAAVLAGGLDVSVLRYNRDLADRIAGHGCLLSEWPPGTEPRKSSFPWRNRIIAGLARIVVVVEAARRSGTSSTVDHALAAGREVMAVPGNPLLATSFGANKLLVDGAKPVYSVDDVLRQLGELPELDPGPAQDGPPPGPIAAAGTLAGEVLDALTAAPEPLETIAGRIAAPVPALLAALTRLEILGLADAHPGQRYSRSDT